MTELKPCGTAAAYRRHKYLGETPCELCFQAMREYSKAQNKKNPERYRRSARAQGIALKRLSKMFPVEYRALYNEEKAK